MSIIDRIKTLADRKSKRTNRRNVINSDLKASAFRRLPNFDWEDEGVLFDPTGNGTPWDDIGEFAWLEIRDNPVTPTHQTGSGSCGVRWSGLYANGCLEWWAPVKHTEQSDKVQIKDGGFARVWADADNNGTLNYQDYLYRQNSVGSLLVVNSTEKANYYAWIDVIGSHVFDLKFTGSGGVQYVSTYCNQNGSIYSGTNWLTLGPVNLVTGSITMNAGASRGDRHALGLQLSVLVVQPDCRHVRRSCALFQ